MKELAGESIFIEKAIIAVADSCRMSILKEILEKGSIRCSDMVSMTGLSQPTCSHHIKLLTDSGLLECRKDGRYNHFTLNRKAFRKLIDYLEKFSED